MQVAYKQGQAELKVRFGGAVTWPAMGTRHTAEVWFGAVPPWWYSDFLISVMRHATKAEPCESGSF